MAEIIADVRPRGDAELLQRSARFDALSMHASGLEADMEIRQLERNKLEEQVRQVAAAEQVQMIQHVVEVVKRTPQRIAVGEWPRVAVRGMDVAAEAPMEGFTAFLRTTPGPRSRSWRGTPVLPRRVPYNCALAARA